MKEEENGFVMFLHEEILLENWDEEFVTVKGFQRFSGERLFVSD